MYVATKRQKKVNTLTYQKPICDCGEELILQIDEVVEVEYRIKKDGTLSKRGTKTGTIAAANWGRLYCPKCENLYDYNYNFRGEDAFKYKREELL